MANNHCTDGELIARLYGVELDDAHLAGCAACRASWERMESRRRGARAEPHVPPDLLRQQRVAIDARIQASLVAAPMRPLAVVSLAALFLLALLLHAPAPRPQTSVASQSADDQLFEAVFSEAASDEPHPMAPLHALFEVNR